MLNALAATDSLTTEWLTEALHEAGALPNGAVVACETRANAAFNSTASHLTLTYSADAPADAPRHLFLKRNLDAEWASASARDEVRFYRAVARIDPRPTMIVPCYLAIFDDVRKASSLLLADISESHQPPRTRDQMISGESIPDEAALDLTIDTLAAFHAAWWERPELGTIFA